MIIKIQSDDDQSVCVHKVLTLQECWIKYGMQCNMGSPPATVSSKLN